jgi:hypothetical protein
MYLVDHLLDCFLKGTVGICRRWNSWQRPLDWKQEMDRTFDSQWSYMQSKIDSMHAEWFDDGWELAKETDALYTFKMKLSESELRDRFINLYFPPPVTDNDVSYIESRQDLTKRWVETDRGVLVERVIFHVCLDVFKARIDRLLEQLLSESNEVADAAKVTRTLPPFFRLIKPRYRRPLVVTFRELNWINSSLQWSKDEEHHILLLLRVLRNVKALDKNATAGRVANFFKQTFKPILSERRISRYSDEPFEPLLLEDMKAKFPFFQNAAL